MESLMMLDKSGGLLQKQITSLIGEIDIVLYKTRTSSQSNRRIAYKIDIPVVIITDQYYKRKY
jgi:hypothetical protein